MIPYHIDYVLCFKQQSILCRTDTEVFSPKKMLHDSTTRCFTDLLKSLISLRLAGVDIPSTARTVGYLRPYAAAAVRRADPSKEGPNGG